MHIYMSKIKEETSLVVCMSVFLSCDEYEAFCGMVKLEGNFHFSRSQIKHEIERKYQTCNHKNISEKSIICIEIKINLAKILIKFAFPWYIYIKQNVTLNIFNV